jgi:lipopolysaccharide/colanic/teichoic acid biosynthesis glycosyltransferase
LVRRLVDLVLAVPAVIILGPAMLALAAAIRAGSAGPAIFRQVRIGRDGVPFTILKFRTMRDEAAAPTIQMGGREDQRITRLGGLLRRTRLDELPQLINVIRGEMTMVGPRAEVPQFVDRYTAAQREVLSVPPGITGPGQLEYAHRFEPLLDGVADPNQVYVDQILGPKLEIDLDYVRHRSMVGDLRILARTAMLVLGRDRG